MCESVQLPFLCHPPAEVDVVHKQPVSSLQCLHQHPVDPLKGAMAVSTHSLSPLLFELLEVCYQLRHIYKNIATARLNLRSFQRSRILLLFNTRIVLQHLGTVLVLLRQRIFAFPKPQYRSYHHSISL